MQGVRALERPHGNAGAASRYETFVIRMWVKPDAVVEHGEIRHVGTNRTVRFRELERAFSLIGDMIQKPATRVAEEYDS